MTSSPVATNFSTMIRYALDLLTVEGFVACYEQHLAALGNKAAAYEETERTYETFFMKRRYADRDSFYTTLWRYNENKKVKAMDGFQ
ncbi:hypothetical protein BN8_03664 [Fibrisoma limi BUZ 3]|uniref:Uncharacterized protein n=1 Tax=Fibrisoma limi BUZ 3 TaxID=1185876 RepID=I2GKR3_9BACT|nr:hypothetical protein [Fibrisoma limi]CCH54489.1 hypothetical protein BN8_03664 [Fibrisoma limi BUZ 3]